MSARILPFRFLGFSLFSKINLGISQPSLKDVCSSSFEFFCSSLNFLNPSIRLGIDFLSWFLNTKPTIKSFLEILPVFFDSVIIHLLFVHSNNLFDKFLINSLSRSSLNEISILPFSKLTRFTFLSSSYFRWIYTKTF